MDGGRWRVGVPTSTGVVVEIIVIGVEDLCVLVFWIARLIFGMLYIIYIYEYSIAVSCSD